MTEAEALAELTIMVDATANPVLNETDMQSLLTTGQTNDELGRTPGSEGWTPTWELNKAAARGWLLKAGRAASMIDLSAEGGASVKASQRHAHAMAMYREYLAKAEMIMPIMPPDGEVYVERWPHWIVNL